MVSTPAKQSAFSKLNPRQKKIVLAYLEPFNATQAYVDAGYSPVQARKNAFILKANQGVRQALVEMLPLVGVTPDRVRSEIASIAFTPIPDGTPIEVQHKLQALTTLAKVVGLLSEQPAQQSSPPASPQEREERDSYRRSMLERFGGISRS